MSFESIFTVFEVLGTIAFAISGTMEAVRHRMDLFGVAMMGIVAATGGGVIRDIIIGATPPAVFRNPGHAVLALCVSLVVFLLLRFWHRKTAGALHRFAHIYERIYLLSDTLGLAVFTMVGIEAAGRANGALLLFVGVITGVGGGVLRDVLAGTVPSIFRKNIYALASAAGALADILLMKLVPHQLAMMIGFIVIVVIRLLAAHFRWNLPKVE